MDAGHGQGGENPDETIVYKKVRACAPVLIVAVIAYKTIHALAGKAVGSLFQGGLGRVVQHDETGAPGSPLQGMAVSVKGVRGERQPDDGLPIRNGWHKISL